MLNLAHNGPNFGNAGEVDILLQSLVNQFINTSSKVFRTQIRKQAKEHGIYPGIQKALTIELSNKKGPKS